MTATTIYVAIGNSDDRLTQRRWAGFHERIDHAITETVADLGAVMHGRWVSPSTDPHQNACWAFSEPASDLWRGVGGGREFLRGWLREIAGEYEQDSVAWTEGRAEFLPGDRP